MLHDVEVAAETDEIRDRIGFRTVETRGSEILLDLDPEGHRKLAFEIVREWNRSRR